MQTNTLESRRFWRQPKAKRWSFDSHDFADLALTCTACGLRTLAGDWRGQWFCSDCIERGSQAHLDSDYDDLGVPG